MRDVVVLVNEQGEVLGSAEKLAAHEAPGQLHLAFSVVLYRRDGKILLQQRAGSKYHFPMQWANACCSHPGPGDDVLGSAIDRVKEELGVSCELTEVGSFVYRAPCDATGRVEYELDHVFVGFVESDLIPDPDEVHAIRWVDEQQLASLQQEGVTVPWLESALRLAEVKRPPEVASANG